MEIAFSASPRSCCRAAWWSAVARRSQRPQRETFGLSGLHAPPVALSDCLPLFEEHREQSGASQDHRRALVATARSRTTACPGGLPLASSTEARPPRDALAARVRSALREISCSWSPPSEEPLSAPMVGNRAISVSFHTQHRGMNNLGQLRRHTTRDALCWRRAARLSPQPNREKPLALPCSVVTPC